MKEKSIILKESIIVRAVKKRTKFCGVEKCCGKDKLDGLLAVHVENATDYLLRKGEMYVE